MIDSTITEAINEAIEKRGKYSFNESLSKKIIAWFIAISAENEKLEDTEEAFRRINVIFESIDIKELLGE